MNCFCELPKKQYIKFQKKEKKKKKKEIFICCKTGFTIDSSLENYEESRNRPCEFYEETVINEKTNKNNETIASPNNIWKPEPEPEFDYLIPLITYFLAERRHETYNKLIKEIPLKYKETVSEYIERLKTFI